MNVDGSFLWFSDRWGIGGVVRDSEGKFLIQFSKEVRVNSTVHVEVVALREGLLVAAASSWASFHSFIFESNSKLAVSWVVDPFLALWRYDNFFRECCNVFGLGITWSIYHISRIGNEAMDVARMW